MRYILYTLLVITTLYPCLAVEDTTRSFGYEVGVSGSHIYQDLIGSNRSIWEHQISMPESIKQRRRRYLSGFNGNTVSDNPLYHGASQVEVSGVFRPVAGIECRASVIAEHRGQSYGVFAKQRLLFIPFFNVALDTSIMLMGEPLRAHLSAGNERNKSLYEGLTIYNIETQGYEAFLQYSYFRLTYHKISDLRFGYQINISDVDNWIVSAEALPLTANLHADIRLGRSEYSREYDDNYTVSVGVYDSNFRLYGQIASRKHSLMTQYPFIERKSSIAAVVGIRTKYVENSNFRMEGGIEIRTYNNYYNAGYYAPNSTLNYRDEGNFIYPLYLYDRPFSQWAAFTEYQDERQTCVTAHVNATWKFYSNFVAVGNADLNNVTTSASSSFIYPFYMVGVGWEPRQGVQLLASMTNKGMDLNTHYPGGFYLYKKPMMHLSFVWDFRVK
ncbi:MAG: hypothetical protein IPM69_13195 [Ignavibacteria bacterium]|nr:hypothetical protein [Ignavibacteria bacterium]